MGNTTSHQPDERVFGKFKCTNCNRQWDSGYSWADTYQECKRCKTAVYPHTQVPLSHAKGLTVSDLRKPHSEELCEKCQKLGKHCGGYSKPDESGCTIQ